jgi:hypothetical protein
VSLGEWLGSFCLCLQESSGTRKMNCWRDSLTDHEEEGSTHLAKQHHILSLNLPDCKMWQHKTGTCFTVTFARFPLAKKEYCGGQVVHVYVGELG